jgi:hypothetical protein
MRSRDFLKDYDQLFFNLMYRYDNSAVSDELIQCANVYGIEKSILTDSNIRHFFIETTELFDFLSSCSIRKNPQVISFIKENGLTDDINLSKGAPQLLKRIGDYNKEHIATIEYTGVIHHMDSRYPSIKFMLQFYENPIEGKEPFVTLIIDDGALFDLVKIVDGELTASDGGTDKRDVYRRVVWNLLMYTFCFSENTVVGFPTGLNRDEIFQAKLTQKNSTTLTIREEFLDKETRVISPHVRGGYFKTLTSEFFVHKRGQIIYVNPTFIVGKSATTVIENDEIEHEGK